MATARPLVWLLFLLAFPGCGGAQKANEDLVNDIRAFQEGLRWRRYEAAAEHIPPALRERFLDQHEEVDADLRIDDYDIQRVHVTDEHTRALVTVKFTWHLDSVGRVHDTVLEESWERQGKIWRIVSAWKRHGADMPAIFDFAAPER
jgi:hypothetical protein